MCVSVVQSGGGGTERWKVEGEGRDKGYPETWLFLADGGHSSSGPRPVRINFVYKIRMMMK